MSAGEREEFLAGVHIGVLSAAAGTAGRTLAVPVWYSYQPGGQENLGGKSERDRYPLHDAVPRFNRPGGEHGQGQRAGQGQNLNRAGDNGPVRVGAKAPASTSGAASIAP